jgi:hypothetical protein
MGLLKSLFEHIKEIFLGKKEEGKKFLGYFRQERLKFLEEFIGTGPWGLQKKYKTFYRLHVGQLAFCVIFNFSKEGKSL